jgi:Leucine-rich repeat (LRR) protein
MLIRIQSYVLSGQLYKRSLVSPTSKHQALGSIDLTELFKRLYDPFKTITPSPKNSPTIAVLQPEKLKEVPPSPRTENANLRRILPKIIEKLSPQAQVDWAKIKDKTPEAIENYLLTHSLDCQSIQVLDLSNLSLTELPSQIRFLKNLTYLYLGYNAIERLPDELGSLKNLEVIDLTANKLKTLPNSICNLTNLTALHLSGNNLSTLPQNLGALYKLRNLSLGANQFQTLPESVCDITSLENLKLWGNPISRLPSSFKELSRIKEINTALTNIGIDTHIEYRQVEFKITLLTPKEFNLYLEKQ